MKRSHKPVAFGAFLSIAATMFFASSADAQIRVGRFGGVSVNVPFVGVDVLPFGGGTRVRAPFTSVNTGLYGVGYGGYGYRAAPITAYRGYSYRGYGYPTYGYGYNSYVRPYGYGAVAVPVPVPVPVYPDPYGVEPDYVYTQPLPVDAPEYYAARPPAETYQSPTSTGSLEDDLRIAADRLARSLLSRRDDADVWMDYLKPDLIVQTIDQGGSPAELQSLLMNYEGLSGNSQLSSIWVTDGFRQTHRLLRQWVETTPPSNPSNPSTSSEPNVSEEEFGASIYEDPYADREPTRAKPIERTKPTKDGEVESLPAPAATKAQPIDL